MNGASAKPATAENTTPAPTQLRRVRWAVRATLLLGVAASVAANILHARANPISQAIAAWPPLALLLTVELIARIPVHQRAIAAIRIIATTIIAGIAAWVSYWHMAGVAARYGETGASPYLLPFSVDGLIVIASISLVEIANRIRSAHDQPLPGQPQSAAESAPTQAIAAPARVTSSERRRDTPGRTQKIPVQRDDAAGAARPDEAPAHTAAAVAYWYSQDPNLHPAEIGERIGRSERTVRRYWPPRPEHRPVDPHGSRLPARDGAGLADQRSSQLRQ